MLHLYPTWFRIRICIQVVWKTTFFKVLKSSVLYPTWFRLNAFVSNCFENYFLRCLKVQCCTQLDLGYPFVSNCFDIKVLKILVLYPTWFRLNTFVWYKLYPSGLKSNIFKVLKSSVLYPTGFRLPICIKVVRWARLRCLKFSAVPNWI